MLELKKQAAGMRQAAPDPWVQQAQGAGMAGMAATGGFPAPGWPQQATGNQAQAFNIGTPQATTQTNPMMPPNVTMNGPPTDATSMLVWMMMMMKEMNIAAEKAKKKQNRDSSDDEP